MVMKKSRRAAAAATLAGAMAISGWAGAAIVYTCDVTGTAPGGPVSGTAVITVSAHSYTLVLTDTNANVSAPNQEISGLQVTFATPLGSPTLASQSGALIDITIKKKVVSVTPVAGNPDWTLTPAVDVTALGVTPKYELIIGHGPYTVGKDSIRS